MRTLQVLVLAAVGALLQLSYSAGGARFETVYTLPTGVGELVVDNGSLYGFAVEGNCGTVFEMHPPTSTGGNWTQTPVYAFTGTNGDVCNSIRLAAGGNGAIYGITSQGGASGNGGVFELAPPAVPGGAWTESVLLSFTFGIALDPFAIIVGPNGTLYVATTDGGTGYGVIYTLQPPSAPGDAWSVNQILSFSSAGVPYSLSLGHNGVLYGAVGFGGSHNDCGALFEVTPPATAGGQWTESVLYNFKGLQDGVTPNWSELGPDGFSMARRSARLWSTVIPARMASEWFSP